MKTKAAFIIGTGIGYVLGTRAGRRQFEVIKGHARELWTSESVQSTVSTLQEKATEVARDQGAALKVKVTDAVKNAGSKDHGATPAGDPWSAGDGVGHA